MNNAKMNRRTWLQAAAGRVTAGGLAAGATTIFGQEPPKADGGGVSNLGSRRELFIDDFLIERTRGAAEQRLHHPAPQEMAIVHDAPWEGTGSGYHSVFQDGDRYRMYYKAWHLAVSKGKVDTGQHPLYCCYAESSDGIHWEKPELGLYEFQGSTKNNITLASQTLGPLKVDAGHPAVFKDENPEAAADAKYKAFVRSSGPSGLLPFKSADGLHWSPMTAAPIFGGLGAFDSQNLAFWDPTLGQYRAYWRIFTEGRRGIRTAVSPDFIHWSKHHDLTYGDSPAEHLYTNQIKPYHRAPHILIGFPTRYTNRGWTQSAKDLPEREHREMRSSAVQRYGTVVTEGLVMSSRDGRLFNRWNDAFLRPGPERPGTWNYGHQYIAWHVVETKSALAGAANELSLYAGESYWTGKGSALRRYTLRLDGFVSMHASMQGGELLTKPFVFKGGKLSLNFASSAAGGIRVELQRPDGSALPGHALDDSDVLYGDTVERVVSWKGAHDVRSLSGQPLRLRFELKDADLYSLQFS